MTVNGMLAAYYEHADAYYRDQHGEPTYEAKLLRWSGRKLAAVCGEEQVKSFGPKKLKLLRQALIDDSLSRGYINDTVARIKRIFRWAVSEELAPASLSHALSAVEGLHRHRTAARETKRVMPVDDFIIASTVYHLTPVVADMVRIQRLTGCRPGEVCILRPCDVDCSAEVWVYRPQKHKSAWRGHDRKIFIGPQAQAILGPYLKRQHESYCFSPMESVKAGPEARAAKRITPRRRFLPVPAVKADPRRAPTDRYTRWSYRRAICRACDRAFVQRWSPNQLRHTAATEIRKQYGLEAAQVILGHSKADVTQVYAERNERLALEVVTKAG